MSEIFAYSPKHSKGGFTLLELSIVLVIIGLIVGGILVGQELIRGAEIRSTVAQYEKYNTAINTFLGKYNGLPGDLVAGTNGLAERFELCPTAGCLSGAAGNGDGNGLIEGGALASQLAQGETLMFWHHLSAANLIEAQLGAELTTTGTVAADTSAADVSRYVPQARLARGNYFNVAASSGINYYVLSAYGTVPISAAGVYTFRAGLTPIESYNIDAKVDDGMPNLGVVQARGTDVSAFDTLSVTNAATQGTAAGDCTVGAGATDTASTYSRGEVAGNAPACILRMRFN